MPLYKYQTRNETLDILRGFAVFGIFMVNFSIMNAHFIHNMEYYNSWAGSTDILVLKILEIFFFSKFFTIYAFFFGIGLTLQLKMNYDGSKFLFFLRRTIFLFSIGILNLIFLWSGDIIHIFAIITLIFILIYGLSPKLMIPISIILLLLPAFDFLFDKIQPYFNSQPLNALEITDKDWILQVYEDGTYRETLQLRRNEYRYIIKNLFTTIVPMAFFMMTLGSKLVISKKWEDLIEYAHKIKGRMILLFLAGFATFIIFRYWIIPNNTSVHGITNYIEFISLLFGNIAISLSYLWLIAFLLKYKFFYYILKPLVYVGRMSLSNYILQSIIGLFIFTNMGLSLYNTLNPYSIVVIVIMIFALQIMISRWWLLKFKYGPLEYLNHLFTYWEYEPNNKNKE